MPVNQADFVYAEVVLRHGYASEEQVEECLALLKRLRGELELEETLGALLVKKGYLAPAQAHVIDHEIDPNKAGRPKNAIEGYRLLERLGSGAMGSVYKAHHLKLDIPVALKVLRPSLASSRTQIERLKREAQLAARLNHENVVRGLDVGESNGFHYLALEYVDGTTVRELLRRGPLKEKEALRIIRDVARGLEHAHENGVVHRDVKPGNIMMTRDGRPKLADFGLARGKGPSDLTLEHASIGTPQYVAPEQMRRGADATTRSDLFSLGASLYHMLTGRPPFHGETLGEIVQNVLACRFDPPESIVPDLSLDAVYVIHRLMRPHPRERYASASELLVDLERLERGERVAPADFLGDYRAFLKKRRTRRTALVAAAVAVVLIGGAFLFVRQRNEQKAAELEERCAVARATEAATAPAARSVGALQQTLKRMETARAAGAECGGLSELDARIGDTRQSMKALRVADAAFRRSGKEGADFRGIDAELAQVKPPLAGAREAVEGMREDLAKASGERAYRRYTRIMQGFAARDEAVAAVAAFAKDLQKRYLDIRPGEGALTPTDVAGVIRGARLLEQLNRSWDAADKTFGEEFETRLRAKKYAGAAEQLRHLKEAQDRAKEAARSDFTKQFFNLYPDNQDSSRLRAAEEIEWSEVRRKVDERLAQKRPDRADRDLADFESRTDIKGVEVRDLRRKVGEERTALHDAQMRIHQIELERFRQELRDREYGKAARRAADTRAWLPGPARHFKLLKERAAIVAGLDDRFLRRARRLPKVRIKGGVVPGNAISRTPGDDPDRFLMTVKGKATDLYLRELKRGELEKILAFDDKNPADRTQQAHFYAAEAFRAERNDPYHAEELLKEALKDLGGAWAKSVVDDLHRTEKRIADGEELAAKARAGMLDAMAKGEDVLALSWCATLLELSWTKYCEPFQADHVEKQKQLELRARGRLRRRDSGVPQTGFTYESNIATILYTGKPWYLHEGKEPEGVDREKWLERTMREEYLAWFTKKGIPPNEALKRYQRARYQRLDWEGDIDATTEAGYLLAGGLWDNARVSQGAPGRIKSMRLRNHFDLDKDWRVEVTVDWKTEEPWYFALTAGQVQVVLVMLRNREGDHFGGAQGVALLERMELDGPEDHPLLAIFHTAGAKKRKRPKKGEQAHLDGFKRDTDYRMRLERKGDRILFSMTPVGEALGEPVLNKRYPAAKLHSLLLDRKGEAWFRFYGRTKFELRDVQVKGALRGLHDGQ